MRALGDNYVCRCKTGAAGVPIDLLDGYLNSESSKLTPRLAVVYKIAGRFEGKLWLVRCLEEASVYDLT